LAPSTVDRRLSTVCGYYRFAHIDGRVRGGKPCFIDTRVTVYDVLEYLAGGMTAEQIVADLPELTEAHVRAALEFAARRERRLAESA